MRVLLCSPYRNEPGIIQGGISVWAQNVMEYYDRHKYDMDVRVVPFDRWTYVGGRTNMLKRVWSGFNEYRRPIHEVRIALTEGNYDVLHMCTSASISFLKDIIVLRMAKKKGVKTVIHFHFGRIPELFVQKNWEWKLLTKVLKLADVALTMDNSSFRTLKACCYKQAMCLPNPLKQSIVDQIDSIKDTIVRDPKKLLFVGHVVPTKGVYELVKVCKKIEGIRLCVIGKVQSDVHEEMKRLSDNGDWLEFRGEIPHEEVIKEMLSAQVFVLPTYTEGFPNVILESMACGCPIVTTDVGAIPEMLDIANGFQYGICVKPCQVEELYQAVKKMLDDKEYAMQCGQNAQRRVNEMYAMPIVWEQLCEVWQTL